MKRPVKLLFCILIIAMTVLLSVNASGKIEAYLNFYGENKPYCDDVRNDIPFNKSQKAKESVFSLTDKLTQLALSFYGEDAFSDTPSVLSDIEKARKHYKDTAETEIYLCNECIRENNVKKEYVEKGYIVLRTDRAENVIYEGKPYFAEADEEKIRRDNEIYLEERINDIKRSSIKYAQLSDYVKGLRNTEYVVYDGEGRLLLANTESKRADEAEEYFRGLKNHLILKRGGRDEQASFSDSLTFLSEGFEFPQTDKDYLLFISVDEKLDFDGNMKEAESFYNDINAGLRKYTAEMRSSLILCILALTVFAVVSAFMALPKNKKGVLFAFHLFLAVTVLSSVMTVLEAKTVIDALASLDPVKLSAGLSAAALRVLVPLGFLSAEGLIASAVCLFKIKR